MNNISTVLETNISSSMETLEWVSSESSRLYNLYFKSDASGLVSGLSSGTDAATVDTKITKDEYLAGITFMQNVNNFFGNSAVTQSDYLQSMNNVIYGNDAASAQLSYAVEEIGTKMKAMFITMYSLYEDCILNLKIYSESKISTIFTSLSDSDIMYGTSLTKANFVSFMTCIEQYKKMINNEVVTTGDYLATVSKRPR